MRRYNEFKFHPVGMQPDEVWTGVTDVTTHPAQEVGLSVGRKERDEDVLISNQCTRGENRLLEPTRGQLWTNEQTACLGVLSERRYCIRSATLTIVYSTAIQFGGGSIHYFITPCRGNRVNNR